MNRIGTTYLLLVLLLSACHDYEVIVRGGTVYDGSGATPIIADIGIQGDTIAFIGDLSEMSAATEIDAEGKAVAPGMINALSWAGRTFFSDGRSMSDLKQGVTLEVFGEGSSLGPYKRTEEARSKGAIGTFGEHMQELERKGVSTNIASFVGATTVRQYVLGNEDTLPTVEQLQEMQQLVANSMEEGALGVGSSLIYAPAFFASTEELVALAKTASVYGGVYTSHMRSEGDRFLEALDELLYIAAAADIPAEIHHLKAAGEINWHKLDEVLARIDSVNHAGLTITTNMYTYTGASTGLWACLPPWVRAGGKKKWMERLQDPEIRAQVIAEMESEETEWENFYRAAGKPENILLLEFDVDSLNQYIGMDLGEVATIRETSPAETIIDLLVENQSGIGAVYFLMSEENVRKQMQLPYMSFCSDARSVAAEGKELESMTHPRTFGNFARLLGKYVREEKVLSLEEAIHKATALPAQKFNIQKRGTLKPGYYADVIVFDPDRIADKATFRKPHQYAVGMEHVLVNGVRVIANGEHTGETPGQFVKGPGYGKEVSVESWKVTEQLAVNSEQ
ncbi:D-aminoacylase [Algivirga pacifica]|uniref:Amidohydrolase family protein n=1 Tax=Algivirga pacifica TaxID=1162670 RepID=A0ABP9D2Z4_9BACT